MTAKSKVHEHNKKNKTHSNYGMISQNTNIKRGSSEIWSDKVSLIHIKVTQRGGEHGGESRQPHGGAEGTKSDRAVVYVLLITLVISSVPPRTNGASVPDDYNDIKPLCSPLLCVTIHQSFDLKRYHSKLLKTLNK